MCTCCPKPRSKFYREHQKAVISYINHCIRNMIQMIRWRIKGSPVCQWSGAVERLALTVYGPLHGKRSYNTNLVDSRWLQTWVISVWSLNGHLSIFHCLLRTVTGRHIQPARKGGWPPVGGVDEGAGGQDQGGGELLHLLALFCLAQVGEKERCTPGCQNDRNPQRLHDCVSLRPLTKSPCL